MKRALLAALALLAVTPGSAAAAGWDPTPLEVSPASESSPSLGPVVETTDDGAVWVAWSEDRDNSGQSDVIVRRIGADGVPGEPRVLTSSSPQYFGSISLAPAPDGEMRVAYVTDAGGVLALRRLTPTVTGDPIAVYDKATADDGDTSNNGNVSPGTVKLLAAPGGAAWVKFVRIDNAVNPIVSARRVSDVDAMGPLVGLSQLFYEPDAAVNPAGQLVIAMGSGGQGRVAVRRIGTDGSVESEVEIRAADAPGPTTLIETPAIGIDGTGIATVGWNANSPSAPRHLQARRVDTTTTPMTPLGAAPTPLDDGLATDFVQYGPLFGVDPGGDVLMGWSETDSFNEHYDAFVRVLSSGALADSGVVGDRLQLDGPPPEGGFFNDVVPGPAGVATALIGTSLATCEATRIDLGTGAVLDTETLAASNCGGPVGPATGADGLVASWSRGGTYEVVIKRYVETAPSCTNGAPATVTAGKTVTLTLACTGWRPMREITTAPTRGTLGSIDQSAQTVVYTAGSAAGTDVVGFHGVNGAGASAERSVAVTVALPAAPPGPGPGPGPGPADDRTAPTVTGLAISPRRLHRKRLKTPVLQFTLSEAATAVVTVERLVKGRRKAGRCVTRPLPRRGKRCTKAKAAKRLSQALPAGAASLRIALGSRRRPPAAGRYRVTLVATDTAGNASAPQRVTLTVARH